MSSYDYLSNQGYGNGQDRRDGLVWQYAQRQGKPREDGLEITFARDEEAP